MLHFVIFVTIFIRFFTNTRSHTDIFLNWFNDQHKEIINEPVYLSVEGSIP